MVKNKLSMDENAKTSVRGRKIRIHNDLEVYLRGMEAAMRVFELSKSFPKEETYSLTDQIRRASRSVCANLAEAWRKRRYEASFVSKLTESARSPVHPVTLSPQSGPLGNMGAKSVEVTIDKVGLVPHSLEQLTNFICSPLDTPQGLGRGYFFSWYDH